MTRSRDDYWLVATGYLTPSTLSRGTIGGPAAEVKASPSFFDASAYEVQQHFAMSKDGTQVPYFQVAAKDLKHDGGNPDLLSGYGGFEICRTPGYSGTVGRAWLEQRRTRGPAAAASTWWPISAAAASTVRDGTGPRCRPTGTGPTRTSPPWRRT